MRIRTLFVAAAVATLGLFPVGRAQATHNCGIDLCPHPDDVLVYLCKYPVLSKYVDVCH